MASERRFVGLLLVAMVAVCGQASDHRPETWFHLIGGNVSKEGITADLEAVKAAGIGGIQFFHGQFGGPWPGVEEQIPCLSPKWDDLVRHIGLECARLGLTLKLQNCPGWSMSGGPWITDETSMRKLVTTGRGRDYRPITNLTVSAAVGERSGVQVPSLCETNGDVRVYTFARPVTLRTLVLPSAQCYSHDFCYEPGLGLLFEVEEAGRWRTVIDRAWPVSNYSDRLSETFAFAATTGARWRLTIRHGHRIAPRQPLKDPVFSSAVRLDNWEGKAGWTLREVGMSDQPDEPTENGSVTLAFGHVNPEITNHPAPKEATGWECDKLDPKGIEANFAGYIGRLLDGPLKGVPVKGAVVDSWECGAQTWTERMPEYFRGLNGYELWPWLPALFGRVVGSVRETEDFLRDWRRTQGEFVARNYYGRFAELAHARGLEVQYETAMGDVIAGDILSYWKHADTPMCEFWSPHDDTGGFVTSYDFKPVRPCVSAAHIYGKRRVAAEAFTSFKLTWNETLADLKRDADRHFARGVTHLVFHTYTHNPRIGLEPPGSAFGRGIGTPFLRGQSWWRHLPLFTDYAARCGELLERGKPVVDVLWYLGDDCAHKPSEKHPFPRGFKYDYCTFDALATRAAAKDGRINFPDGMSYAVLWVPGGVFLREESRARIAALEASGARVVRGNLKALENALSALVPDVAYEAPPNEGLDDFMWYHRRADGEDVYFLATSSPKGYAGKVRFRADGVERKVVLGPHGSVFVKISSRGVELEDPAGEGARLLAGFDQKTAHILPLASFKMTTPYSHAPTRTYVTELPDGLKGGILSLGRVCGVAEVFVNGRKAATLWCEPYVCDISRFIRADANELRIEVTGTWRNRLIYDAGQPESERKTWTTPMLKPGEAFAEAGLFGPACLGR